MNKNAKHVKAYFARLAEDGIKQCNVLAHVDDHVAIKVFARDLAAKRAGYKPIYESEISGRLPKTVRAWRRVGPVFISEEFQDGL